MPDGVLVMSMAVISFQVSMRLLLTRTDGLTLLLHTVHITTARTNSKRETLALAGARNTRFGRGWSKHPKASLWPGDGQWTRPRSKPLCKDHCAPGPIYGLLFGTGSLGLSDRSSVDHLAHLLPSRSRRPPPRFRRRPLSIFQTPKSPEVC